MLQLQVECAVKTEPKGALPFPRHLRESPRHDRQVEMRHRKTPYSWAMVLVPRRALENLTQRAGSTSSVKLTRRLLCVSGWGGELNLTTGLRSRATEHSLYLEYHKNSVGSSLLSFSASVDSTNSKWKIFLDKLHLYWLCIGFPSVVHL